MKTIWRFSPLLLLAACTVNPQDRARDAVATYGPVCDARGPSRDSAEWRECVAREQQVAANQRAQEAAVYNARRIYCTNPEVYRSPQC